MITGIHHVQIAVAKELEHATIDFYRHSLGLKEIPKPENLLKNGGAWFTLGMQQLHIAPEEVPQEYNRNSKRHLCFLVLNILEAEDHFRLRNVEIIPDNQPVLGWKRFYFRDPAGNRMEIAEMVF
ncbi:bleomycin resistance protein [Segetibacter sp. 3557_3]|uniref:VOC family protein n=1 Tax=Segetibacter sp. 3557_3 TaxID=2547429 RepID=UPI001058FF2E|nr:VOC family protein [Segetibacter sp. 3557_3]TDH18461.1 bleomycin resistance protein [Segetibacter sp. 3557_3]